MDLFAFYLDVQVWIRNASTGLSPTRCGNTSFGSTVLTGNSWIGRFVILKILDLAMPATWEHLNSPSLEEIRSEFQTLVQFMDADSVYIARSGKEPIGLWLVYLTITKS